MYMYIVLSGIPRAGPCHVPIGCRLVHHPPSTHHPCPYTLNPAPITIHPPPFNLHPPPSTLHPRPFTLHPQRSTLNTTGGFYPRQPVVAHLLAHHQRHPHYLLRERWLFSKGSEAELQVWGLGLWVECGGLRVGGGGWRGEA